MASGGRDPSHVSTTVGTVNEIAVRNGGGLVERHSSPPRDYCCTDTSPLNSASKSGVGITVNVWLKPRMLVRCGWTRGMQNSGPRSGVSVHRRGRDGALATVLSSTMIILGLPLFSSWASIGSEGCHYIEHLRNYLNGWKMV